MPMIVLVNIVCFQCKVDNVYAIGNIKSPNKEAFTGMMAEGQKHVEHGGFTLTMQLNKSEEVDMLLKSITQERVRKILAYNVNRNEPKAKEETSKEKAIATIGVSEAPKTS